MIDVKDGLVAWMERGRGFNWGVKKRKYMEMDRGGVGARQERKGSVVRGGGEVWQNGPRGTRPPNWYLNTHAKQNCCYHKKLMN